jgi:crossover junction endodeoxyribonuclease RuvC
MIIGIDPGKSGGLAALNPDGGIRWMIPMPVIGGTIDSSRLREWLSLNGTVCYIESGQAMPKQGVSSMFKFGHTCGLIEGFVAGCGHPYTMVRPHQWQRVMHAGLDKSMHPKQRSLIVAQRLYPGADFRATVRCRKAHDGIVDALLIARFGWQLLGGGK